MSYRVLFPEDAEGILKGWDVKEFGPPEYRKGVGSCTCGTVQLLYSPFPRVVLECKDCRRPIDIILNVTEDRFEEGEIDRLHDEGQWLEDDDEL